MAPDQYPFSFALESLLILLVPDSICIGLAEAPMGLQANTDVVQTSVSEKQAQATANHSFTCTRSAAAHVGAADLGSFELFYITGLLSYWHTDIYKRLRF